MFNGNGRIVATRQVNCAIKLYTDVRFILRIVEEYFSFDYFYVSVLRGAYRLGIIDGYVVEEVKIVTFQRLYYFLYIKQVRGYFVVYVVVDFYGIGYVIDRITNNAFNFVVVYFRAQRIFFQRLFI